MENNNSTASSTVPETKMPNIWLRDNLILKWDWACDEKEKTMMLVVHQDEYPENPRTDYDHVSEMAFFHPRYVLGDNRWTGKSPEDFWKALFYGDAEHAPVITKKEIEQRIASDEIPWFKPDKDDDTPPVDQLRERIIGGKYNQGILLLSKKAFICPVFLYDHSGLTISMNYGYPYNDQFDSSIVGWCIITKDDAIGNLGATKNNWEKTAKECMESEITEYDHYIRGDVWWYELKQLEKYDSAMLADEWTDYDSCSGFIGDTLENSGIADTVDAGLCEALRSGNYKEGTAKAKQVTTWEYDFD